MAHAFTKTLGGLSAVRFILGLGEAGNWPGAAKTVAEWFPVRERAFGMAIFNSGAAIGSIVAPPVIVGLTAYFGHWQPTFLITGALGFLWLILWWIFYDAPEKHRWLTNKERVLIQGNESPNAAVENSQTAPTWTELLRFRQVWAIVLARFFVDPVWWLYIAWLPLYLANVRGFDLRQIGYFAWVPFVAADAGSLFGGWFSGFLIGRGWSVDAARKAVIAFAACLMPAGIAAAFVSDSMVALALIGVVLFGFQVWINNVQTLPSDFFPKNAVGSVAGLGGTGAGIGSMIFIFTTGWVVDNFSYTPILVAAGMLAPIGTIVLFLLSGKIQKVSYVESI
jgi:ACS family hexuronate transporter-like MFS transporter